jgi:hypothetical protein
MGPSVAKCFIWREVPDDQDDKSLKIKGWCEKRLAEMDALLDLEATMV